MNRASLSFSATRRTRHLARLARVLVLLMASALRHQPPSIVFEQPNELAELHVIHRGEGLGWAMPRRVRQARTAARRRQPRGSRNTRFGLRWAAAGMQAASTQFRRVKGYPPAPATRRGAPPHPRRREPPDQPVTSSLTV